LSNSRLAALLAAVILCSASLSAAASRSPSCSREGMAATPHYLATEAAVEILGAGGNAADAAVAAAFALAVVEPYHSGIGGGEFILLRMAKDGQVFALDARECAPKESTPNQYLMENGEPHSTKSARGGLAVGVPGSVAGRVELAKKHGRLHLKQSLAPAIRLAKDGFPADRYLVEAIRNNQDRLSECGAGEAFLRGRRVPHRGDIIIQQKLASTLGRIAADEGKSFYRGEDARLLAEAVRTAGGVMTSADLSDYRVIPRSPVKFRYRDAEIYSMSPPSSGGLCIAEILNILEGFPLSYLGAGSAEALHLQASAFERAFADRREFLADPDFVPQPLGMASEEYGIKRREGIDRAFRIPITGAGDPWIHESDQTSHLSVIDKDGSMVSITTSINGAFGSFVYLAELGFFLNNTMDDFTISSMSANQFALSQGEVNRIEGGKRPLSSMSPTLVLKNGEPWLALGSVGGPRIITSVAQMLLNIIDFGMDVQAAIDAPRIHMQFRPDTLYVEKECSPETIADLRQRGWEVVKSGYWSLSQAVQYDRATGLFYGGSDSRGVGSAAGPKPVP